MCRHNGVMAGHFTISTALEEKLRCTADMPFCSRQTRFQRWCGAQAAGNQSRLLRLCSADMEATLPIRLKLAVFFGCPADSLPLQHAKQPDSSLQLDQSVVH